MLNVRMLDRVFLCGRMVPHKLSDAGELYVQKRPDRNCMSAGGFGLGQLPFSLTRFFIEMLSYAVAQLFIFKS